MYTDDTKSDGGKEDTRRKRHSIDSDIIMKESDLRKSLCQKEAVEMEIRKLKREQGRLLVVLHQKEAELTKLSFEITQMENEVKKLKKELNLL